MPITNSIPYPISETASEDGVRYPITPEYCKRRNRTAMVKSSTPEVKRNFLREVFFTVALYPNLSIMFFICSREICFSSYNISAVSFSKLTVTFAIPKVLFNSFSILSWQLPHIIPLIYSFLFCIICLLSVNKNCNNKLSKFTITVLINLLLRWEYTTIFL